MRGTEVTNCVPHGIGMGADLDLLADEGHLRLLYLPSRPRSFRNENHWHLLLSRCVPNELVGEQGEAVTNGAGVEEAHRLLVAGLPEEALAGSEHDRVDHQPQLVDQFVLDQRAHELTAGGDDDSPVKLLLQLRDLVHHLAP